METRRFTLLHPPPTPTTLCVPFRAAPCHVCMCVQWHAWRVHAKETVVRGCGRGMVHAHTPARVVPHATIRVG